MPGGSNFTLCLLFFCFAKLLLVQSEYSINDDTNKSTEFADQSTSIPRTKASQVHDKSKSILSTEPVPSDHISISISRTKTKVSSTELVSSVEESTSISSTELVSSVEESTSISSTELVSSIEESTSISSTEPVQLEVSNTPETNTYPTTTESKSIKGESTDFTLSTTESSTNLITSVTQTTVETSVVTPACVPNTSCNVDCQNKMCSDNTCVCTMDQSWSDLKQTCLQNISFDSVIIMDVTNTSLFLNWTGPNTNLSTTSSIQYSVIWEAGGNVTSTNVSTETSVNVQDLVPGQKYEFIVVMTSSNDGCSKNIWSSLTNVTTVPDPPDSMNISTNFGPDITLKFHTPGYISYCNVTVVDDKCFNFANTSENCISLEVPGLENGTFYKVNVTAISGDKISMWKMFSFNTAASEPGPVRNLTVMNITATSVVLTWLPPEHPNGHLVGYNITVSDNFDTCFQEFYPNESLENIAQYASTSIDYKMEINGTTTAQSIISGFSDIQLKITNLTSCVFYKITVSAFNMDCACLGVGDSTNFTTNTSVPSEPTNLAINTSTPHWIEITWNETNQDPCNRTYLVELCDTANETVFKSSISNGSKNSVIFTDLPSYHEFYANVTAMTESGNSTTVKSESVYTMETAASAVRGLNITSATNNSLFVTWQKPDELNGVLHSYLARVTFPNGTLYCSINISEEESNDLKKNDLTCNVTDQFEEVNGTVNLTLNNLLPYTNYTLNVTAVNGAGEGNWTQITGKTDIAVPSPVLNFNVTYFNCTVMALHWDPPLPYPGPTYYQLIITDIGSKYYSENGGTEFANNLTPPVNLTDYYNTTYVFNNLTAGWKYSFNLTAVTEKGSSPEVPIELSTEDCEPGLVQDLQAHSIPNNYTAAKVVWKCPDIRERKTNITGFYIVLEKWGDDNKTIERIYNSTIESGCDVNKTQAIIPVEPEYRYQIKVKIIGMINNSSWESINYTAPCGPSEKVQGLNAFIVNSTAINVTWTRPHLPNGNITAYVILLNNTFDEECLQRFTLINGNNYVYFYSNESVECEQPIGNISGTISQDTLTSYIYQLEPEASYTVTVIPYNHYGYGESTDTNVTLPPGSSEEVLDFTITDLSSTNVTVTWTKPLKTNGRLTGYVLNISQIENNSTTIICFGNVSMTNTSCSSTENISDTMQYIVEGIPPHTLIELTLYPINMAGCGQGRTIQNRTLEAVPNPVSNFNVTNVTCTSLTLQWDPPSPCPGRTHYELHIIEIGSVYYKENSDTESDNNVTLNGYKNSTYTFDDLTPAWNYSFTLKAVTAVGPSTEVTSNSKTSDCAPDKVKALNYSTLHPNYTAMKILWECPVIRERKTNITGFFLQSQDLVNNNVYNETITSDCSVNTSTVVSVVPEHNYVVTVMILGLTNSTLWDNITFCASSGPSKEVQHLNVSSVNFTTITVKWTRPDLTNGVIVSYVIWLNTSDRECLQRFVLSNDNNNTFFYSRDNTTCKEPVKQNDNTKCNESVNPFSQDELMIYINQLDPAASYTVTVIPYNSHGLGESDNRTVTLPARPEVPADMGAIVGGVLGSICAVAAVLCFVWYRRRQARKQHSLHYDPVDTQTLSFNVRPVPMHDFKDKVQEWMSQEKTERGMPILLAEQFKEIKELSEKKHSQDAALQDENKGKNRYTNILPYDHSRVKLSIHDNEDSSDFINANYIPGYHSKREYIATQGPLESTVNDFWQMVWEQQVPAILMLSGFMEGRTVKVHAYYPTDNTLFQSISYGAISVMLKEVVETAGYTRKTFEIERNRQSRTVYHFYIKGWKDYDANLPVNPVLAFVQAVRDLVPVNSKHPLLVHCSAGVGRTGTIIGIDYFMHYVREQSLSEPIDIFRYVLLMREYRPSMVQSCEQYVFLHKAVAELVRRKKDPDHYDEPVYTNMAYEEDEHMYANC